MYTHTCIHVHIHTHTHTHVYTHCTVPSPPPSPIRGGEEASHVKAILENVCHTQEIGREAIAKLCTHVKADPEEQQVRMWLLVCDEMIYQYMYFNLYVHVCVIWHFVHSKARAKTFISTCSNRAMGKSEKGGVVHIEILLHHSYAAYMYLLVHVSLLVVHSVAKPKWLTVPMSGVPFYLCMCDY